jgi:nitrite reductase/ring-hydroxylating ferredoxin subunit
MHEHVVARVGELSPGERKVVTIEGIRVGVFRVGDEYFAFRNVCPHQFGPVCEGKIGPAVVAGPESGWEPVFAYHNEVLTCPWHGLEFHIRTGRCLAFGKFHLRAYSVKVEAADIKVVYVTP